LHSGRDSDADYRPFSAQLLQHAADQLLAPVQLIVKGRRLGTAPLDTGFGQVHFRELFQLVLFLGGQRYGEHRHLQPPGIRVLLPGPGTRTGTSRLPVS
jgi:hypothetical protein